MLKMAGSLKNRSLLSLAYGCGLRAGEVVRLRAGDIDSTQGVIRIVQGKGSKDRNVMLPPELLDLLRQWWKERPSRSDAGVPPAERWLFPGIKRGRPLTTRQFGRIFHQSAEAAGIRRPVTLHSLRHSFATHLLEGGKKLNRTVGENDLERYRINIESPRVFAEKRTGHPPDRRLVG